MAYNVKALLKLNKKNKQGNYPIYLRITVNRKVSWISVGFSVPEKMWSAAMEQVKVTHPLFSEINTAINTKKSELINALLKDGANSAARVKELVKRVSTPNFFDFARTYLTAMKNKRGAATLSGIGRHLRKLERFNTSKNLNFEDITPGYLNNYENYLLNTGLSVNYTQLLIRSIRTIFNAARKQDITTFYPFGKYEMLKYKAPDKAFLTNLELSRFKAFETTNLVLLKAKWWFVFGCYSGLRISDWHRFSATPKQFIVNGRLKLWPKKKSTGFVSVPIRPELAEVIEKLKELPFDIREPTLNEKIKKITTNLGINKKLSAHSARHHFAIVQCLEKGISSETAAELMGITLDTFVKNYSVVTEDKINSEVLKAWGL